MHSVYLGHMKWAFFKKCLESAWNWPTRVFHLTLSVACFIVLTVKSLWSLKTAVTSVNSRLIVKTHLVLFWNVFPLDLCTQL